MLLVSAPPSSPVTEVAPSARPAPTTRPAPPRVARGFALYVGVDEDAAVGPQLQHVVEHLLDRLAELAPDAESAASVVVAPAGAGGRSLDVVRAVMLGPDTRALATRPAQQTPGRGVVVDLTRNRVEVDGRPAPLTSTELTLLRLLVEHEGRDVPRDEILEVLWAGRCGRRPHPRTVDVHVRRLRAKLGAYEDVVRTVRGSGYRFDPHADVVVRRPVATGH